MPIAGADQTLLGTHPHKVKFYLVVHQPETALAAQVNGAPTGDPVTTITFDNTSSGAWGNVESGQTLLIGSAAGLHDRGIVRVKSSTATVLTIAESSDLGNVEDDDYITILREHRFWLKFPHIVSLTEIYEDYDEAYVDENTAFAPIAMLGPPGFYFKGAGAVSIPYDFSESFPIAGATISSHATTYQHGDGGSSATSTHTEQYSTATGMSGSETKLTVTDDNGKTAVGWRYDFILDRSGEDAPIDDFFIEGSAKNHWQGPEDLDITIYGSASQTVIRDGAHVWIMFESWYGSTQKEISLEYTNRANILFEGWVVKDSIRRESDHSVVKFTARPTLRMTEEGKAWPATLEVNASPSTWIHVTTCTPVKAALYLCKWRSTLSEITDIHVPSSATSTSGQDWSSGTFRDQLELCLKADALHVVQHKTGMIYFEKHTSMQSSTERAPYDLTIILNSSHWMAPLELPVELLPTTSYILAEGVYYDGAAGFPYFSEAPGIAAKYRGKSAGKLDQLALDDQDHINQLCGDYLAMRNAEYPKLPVRLTGFWPVFDCAPQRRVRVALTAAMNNRGVNVSGTSFLVVGIQTGIDQRLGTAFTELDLEEETDGVDGRTLEYQVYPPSITTIPSPGPYIPPYSPPTNTPADEGRRILATAQGIYVCDNILNTSYRWYSVNGGLSAADDKWAWNIKRDPYHWWTSGGSERTLWASCKSGIWKHENFPHGTWTQVFTIAAINALTGASYTTHLDFARMDFSIEVSGKFAFTWYFPGGFAKDRWWVVVVLNEVMQNQFNTGSNYDYSNCWPDVKWAQHSAGLTCYFCRPFYDPFVKNALYRTINGGANWASVDDALRGRPLSLSVPYEDAGNTGDSYVIWGSTGGYRRSIDGGSTFTTTGWTASWKIGTGGKQNRIFNGITGTPEWSNDAGASWTALPNHGLGVTTAYQVGWNEDVIESVVVGVGGTVMYWAYGDVAWTDITKNLGDFSVGAIYHIERDTMGVA